MHKSVDYVLADVFTDHPFGGNQLAVFPDARSLATSTMQSIARELNLSESTFLFPSNKAGVTRDLRIFTPAAELPFAGHPTIGTAAVLVECALLKEEAPATVSDDAAVEVVLGEGVGPVSVRVMQRNRVAWAELTSPRIPEEVGEPKPAASLAKLLGVDARAISTGQVKAGCYSAGVPFTIVPLSDKAALSSIRLDLQVWSEEFADHPAPHILAVTSEKWSVGAELHARMFAPAMGISEDPATGAAAVALGGFLAAELRLSDGTASWKIH